MNTVLPWFRMLWWVVVLCILGLTVLGLKGCRSPEHRWEPLFNDLNESVEQDKLQELEGLSLDSSARAYAMISADVEAALHRLATNPQSTWLLDSLTGGDQDSRVLYGCIAFHQYLRTGSVQVDRVRNAGMSLINERWLSYYNAHQLKVLEIANANDSRININDTIAIEFAISRVNDTKIACYTSGVDRVTNMNSNPVRFEVTARVTDKQNPRQTNTQYDDSRIWRIALLSLNLHDVLFCGSTVHVGDTINFYVNRYGATIAPFTLGSRVPPR